MPTGYTAYIEDGDITTGKDFLMLCSRAFGVAIDVRDEPLSVPTPTHFEPNPYYQKRYEDSVKELQVVKNMSFTEARDHMRAEHTSRVERAKRQLKMMEEHNGIKKFALSQIDMCVYTPLMFDAYRHDIANELDESDEAVQKYMDELIKLSEDDVKRAVAEYHVGCGAFAIYAGTLNSKNKGLWQNKTECTDEALCAVRDYMVQELLGGISCSKATSSGYEWTLKDGRTVELRVTIR